MTDTTPRYKRSASLRPGMFRKMQDEAKQPNKSIYLKVKFPKGIQFEKDSGKYQTSEVPLRYSSDDSYIGAKAALRNSSTSTNDNNSEHPLVAPTSPKDFSYESEVKVVCLDPHCTVPQAVKSIQSTYKLPQVTTMGLYDAEDKVWLDEKAQLKDIKQLPFLECVEYRNKAEPVNMGSTKQRRKAQTLGKKTGSPFFQNWQESFKDSVRKTEEAKRREEKLSKLLDPREVNDLRDKLIGLSSPKKSPALKESSTGEDVTVLMSPPVARSRSESVAERATVALNRADSDDDEPAITHKRTSSVSKPMLRRAASSEDLTGTEFEATRNDELLLLLQEREEEARLAAQIGQQLLAKNTELLEEIRILRDKEIQLNQMTANYNKLESKLIKFKSRCMFLQTQLDEAKSLNLLLTTQAMDTPQESTPKKKTRSELELEKQLFEKMDELELLKKELHQKIDNETKIMRKNKKLLEDNKMLGDEVDRLKEELAASKNDLTTMSAMKDKLIYSETKYKILALQVEKLGTSNVIDDEILNSSEKMLSKLTELISWSQRSQLNKENPHQEDQELLDSSVKTIQALRQTLSGNQSPEISLPGLLLSWLNVTVQRANDVLNPESQTQEDITKEHEEAQFEMSLVYFLLALLALHRAKALEMKLSQGSSTHSELKSDLEDLTSKLNQEQYTNAKLSERLAKFQNSQHKMQQQEKELMKLVQSEAKLKDQLRENEKLMEELKRSNAELNNKLSAEELEKQTLANQVAALEIQLIQKQQQIDELTKTGSEVETKLAQQLREKDEEISRLTQKASSFEQQLQSELSNSVELKNAIEQVKAQKEELEHLLKNAQEERKQEKEALERQLQEKQNQIESISKQLVEKDMEIQSLISQLKEVQQEKASLQSKLTESDQKILSLTSQLLETEKKLAAALGSSSEKDAMIASLQEQVQNSAKGSSDLHKEVINLNQDLEKKNVELKNSEEQNKALMNQNSELLNQISALQQQQKQTEAICEELKKEVANLNETLQHQIQESQNLKNHSQEVAEQFQTEKQAWETEMTNLKVQLSVKETENSSIRKELTSLLVRFGAAQSESEQLRTQLSAALSEKTAAQQQVSDLQTHSEELRKALEATKKSLEEVEGQLAEEKKEHKNTIEKYEAVVADLNEKIKNLLEKQQQYEKRIQELEQENENLRKQLNKQNETQQETQQELQKKLEVQQKEYEQRLKFAESKKMNQSFLMLDQQTILLIETVNELLKDDISIANRLPIGHTDRELIESMKDGVILCKLINKAVAGTIDERVIKMNCKDVEDMADNHNLVINSAIGIGVSMQNNLTASDLTDGNVFRTVNFIAELIDIIFMSRVNLTFHPELKEIEDVNALINLMPENVLLRWFNYHLKAAKSSPISNFGSDLKDSTKISILLSQIAPSTCFAEPGGPTVDSLISEVDMVTRADIVLKEAAKLNVKKVLAPKDVANGNTRLLTLFVASLFDNCSGIKITPKNENEVVEVTTPVVVDEEGSREERSFRFWMNSLGVVARNIQEDLADGLVLLNLFDKISPGIVNWSKVNAKPNNAFKKIENCNYVVTLAKQHDFSIVGIGGNDIFEGNRKSILSILWQMMRFNYLTILKRLTTGGKQIQETDILKWANDKVASGGKNSSISGFKDPSLKDSIFLIDLLGSIKPGRVDYSLVMRGDSAEDYMLNSKYAISLARRFGIQIFLLWEDIVEVKPKMIMTFMAALMSFCNGK